MQAGALDAIAAALCRRLVAHQFYLDAPALTALGSGELVIDLRHGLCRHGQQWVPPLLTVAWLRALLQEELRRADLAPDQLLVAQTRLQIRLTPQHGGRNGKMTWIGAGEEFIACALEIEIRLGIADSTGGIRHSTTFEWPRECRLWRLPPLRAMGGARLSSPGP